MSIACDIQMATCDLFFWSVIRFVNVDLHLDWSKAGFLTSHANTLQKGSSTKPKNSREAASRIALHNPFTFFTGALFSPPFGSVCIKTSLKSFFFAVLFTFLIITLFNEPFDNALQRAGWGRNLFDSLLWRGLWLWEWISMSLTGCRCHCTDSSPTEV